MILHDRANGGLQRYAAQQAPPYIAIRHGSGQPAIGLDHQNDLPAASVEAFERIHDRRIDPDGDVVDWVW